MVGDYCGRDGRTPGGETSNFNIQRNPTKSKVEGLSRRGKIMRRSAKTPRRKMVAGWKTRIYSETRHLVSYEVRADGLGARRGAGITGKGGRMGYGGETPP